MWSLCNPKTKSIKIKKKILLFIGNSAIDTVVNSNNMQSTHIGGSAVNSSIGAQFTSNNLVTVKIYSTTGNDFKVDLLKDFHIDTSNLQKINKPSNKFFIDERMESQRNQNKNTFFSKCNKNLSSKLIEDSIQYSALPIKPLDFGMSVDHLHISIRKGMFLEKILKNISYKSMSIDVKSLHLDDTIHQVKFFLPKIKFLFCNNVEYLQLRRLETSLFGAIKFHNLSVFVTNENGVLFLNDNEKIHYKTIKFLPKDIVSLTGAGDVFLGAFLSSFSKEKNLRSSIFEALSLASLSVQDFGVTHVFNKRIEFEQIKRKVLLLNNSLKLKI